MFKIKEMMKVMFLNLMTCRSLGKFLTVFYDQYLKFCCEK